MMTALLDVVRDAVAAEVGVVDTREIDVSTAAASEEFLRLARDHQLVPLVYEYLRRGAPPPATGVLEQLREEAGSSARRALAQAAQTVLVARELAHSDVPALFLKGAPLAVKAYGSGSRRQPGDVDVLVKPEALDAAIASLARAGYELWLRYTGERQAVAAYRSVIGEIRSIAAQGGAPSPMPRLVARRWASFLRLGNELSFHNGERGVVDLHWKAFRNDAYLPIDLWEHRSSVVIGGTDVVTLSPEAELVYLVAHGAAHSWRLKWLVDLPFFVVRVQPDLSAVSSLAASAGLEPLVGAAMHLCATFFGAPSTEAVSAHFRDDGWSRRLASVWARRLLDDPKAVGSHEQVADLLYRLTLRRGWQYWVRQVEDSLAPANWWLDLAARPGPRPLRVALCVVDQGLRGRSRTSASQA